MKLRMPQEIEVWYLLPAIRREFAREMSKRGVKQREISRILGITEAAVSQYINYKRASGIRFSKDISREIKASVDRLEKNSDNVIEEMQRICRLCKDDKTLCRIHKKHGKIPSKCDVCFSGR